MFLSFASAAHAISPLCGATLISDAMLTEDILCPDMFGAIRVGDSTHPNIVLDLGRFTLFGQGNASTHPGVILQGQGAIVKNGSLESFRVGVQQHGSSTRVIKVKFAHNHQYHIQAVNTVNSAATSVTFSAATFVDEIIHMSHVTGYSVDKCLIKGTQFAEAIYILDSDDVETTCKTPKGNVACYMDWDTDVPGEHIATVKTTPNNSTQCKARIK